MLPLLSRCFRFPLTHYPFSFDPHPCNSCFLKTQQSASFLDTPEFKKASRKGKEELIARYQKRQQQNRDSQRNFRQRQARLVEDLRAEIERLRRENERLTDEVLGLRKSEKEEGDDSWKRKEKVKEMEVEAVVMEDEHLNGDDDGERQEE